MIVLQVYITVKTEFLITIDEEFEIDYEFNLWNKPHTNEIRVYKRDSVGGDGLVKVFTNRTIARHLRSNKPYTAKAVNEYVIQINLND